MSLDTSPWGCEPGDLPLSLALDRQALAEKIAAIERHLARVASCLPPDAADLALSTDAADAVVLHWWQAVQQVVDLALGMCLHLKLRTPAGYPESFLFLADSGYLDQALAQRLARVSDLNQEVTHAYEKLDMVRVHRAATEGPADLRAFLAVLQRLV